MTYRAGFSNGAMILASIALVISSCAVPTPPRPTTQRAPITANAPLATPAHAPIAADATSSAIAPAADAASLSNRNIVRIGLLLPLTGRHAELGRALQDAATVSLFDKYARLSLSQQTVRVELLPQDTGDTPEQAARAMEAALAQGAEFIIGPLFADATSAAAAAARAKNISVLSLSNTRTQASPGTYMFGFSPAEQTTRIVNYALRNGKGRIAVLVPDSTLGETVRVAASEAAQKQGQTLVREAKYTPAGNGIDAALNQLITPGKPPTFDAILIPEAGPALATIMRGLSARGVKPSTVKFLGTGLWDDAELLRRVNLDSAWFASSPPALTAQFEERYRATYRATPPRIASLAYDAVALAVTLATSGRPFDTPTLTNSAGFAGPANGVFRLRANGTVERGLAVIQVDAGTMQVISPTPTNF